MTALALVRDDSAAPTPAEAFRAALPRWRMAAGMSQKQLATATGYTPSYVSKAEKGTVNPSREFAESADKALGAGRAVISAWHAMNPDGGVRTSPGHAAPASAPGDLAHLHRNAVLRRAQVARELAELQAELAYLDAVLSVPLPAPPGGAA